MRKSSSILKYLIYKKFYTYKKNVYINFLEAHIYCYHCNYRNYNYNEILSQLNYSLYIIFPIIYLYRYKIFVNMNNIY